MVAQALHWFNIEAFGKEAGRVLKPGGVLAAWTYGMTRVNPAIDATVDYLYEPVLGPYWPAERKLIESGYQDIRLPFAEMHSPRFEMSHQWNLHQFTGYLKTWSAVRYYQRKHGVNPVDIHYNQLVERWGDPERIRRIMWPLTVKIWRNPVC